MVKTFSDGAPTPKGTKRFHTVHFAFVGMSGNGTAGTCDLHFWTPDGEPNYCTMISPLGVQSMLNSLTQIGATLPTMPAIPVFALAGQLPGKITYGPDTKTYFGQSYRLDVIQAMGVLMIRANLLDQRLIELTARIMGAHPEMIAAQYYATTNMKARLDNVRSLLGVADLPANLTKHLENTLVIIKKVTDRRNDLVHAQWTFRNGRHRAVLHRPNAKVKAAEITVTEPMVLEIAENYGTAHIELLSAISGVAAHRAATSKTAETPSSTDPAS